MPSDARDMPKAIIVIGGGQVGLAAAIALRRALPRTDITILRCQRDPAEIADRAMTSLPRTGAFHKRLGLDEDGLIMRVGASHRLGIRFLNWPQQCEPYMSAYGADSAIGNSVSQSLADANLFAHPADEAASPLSDIDYALRYNHHAYRLHLAALASHLGVQQVEPPMTDAVPDGKGGISHVALAGGSTLAADLFVDCSGPQALLMAAIGPSSFQSWSDMLPCNRLMLGATAQPPALSVTDIIESHPFGWRSTIFSRDGTHHAFSYHANLGSGPDIAHALGAAPGDVIAYEPGRLENSWAGNVVAFGDAAAAFEPLHWANLALAHEQILLFLELLPGCEIDALERAEYNRRAGAMADRMRDYIALHYCARILPAGPFWHYAANLQRSSELALALSEFARRGRLPFFEENILSSDAWRSAMACIGISPGAIAQSLGTPTEVIRDRIKSQQMRSAKAAEMAPPYQQWLKNYIEAKA